MKVKTIPRRKRRGLTIHPGLSPAEKREMNDLSHRILRMCGELWNALDCCDTAVRDTASSGIAYLVQVAYDCQGVELDLKDEAFHGFIANSTAEWFRRRGFAEWFCSGAASLFTTTRPRTLDGFSTFHRRSKAKRSGAKRTKAKPVVHNAERS